MEATMARQFSLISRRSVLIALTVVGVGFAEPSTGALAQSSKSAPFNIGMVTFAGYAPLYLAKEKGFFGDLDVQFQRIEEVPSIRAAVVKGDLDAYLATPDIAMDTNAAAPGKAVWAIDESAGGDGIVVSESIAKLQDLKGKTVAVEPGLPPSFVLMYLLYKNNMTTQDISLKDMSTQDAATAFIGKKVDAAGIYEPYLSNAQKERPGSKVVISSAQTPGLIVDLIFVRDETIKQRPDAIKTIISGWRQAVAYINSNPDDAFDIMAKAFNLPVAEFKDAAGGVKWLDLDENKQLFGTKQTPGPLFANFGVVVDVLKRNRPGTFPARASNYLVRDFVN
jgi:NitT/TauT family transport system substrate-binding protein